MARYAHSAEAVESTTRTRRSWQRYLRQLALSLARIKKQFTFARAAWLAGVSCLGSYERDHEVKVRM